MTITSFLETRDFKGLVAFCLAQLEQGNASSEIKFYLSLGYHEQLQHEIALHYLENILVLEQKNHNVHSLHAAILASLLQYDQALSAANKAINLALESAFLKTNAGAICQQAQNYSLAIQYYKEALSIDPNERTANINLGTCLLLTNEYRKAQIHCLNAIQRFPTAIELYNVISESFIHTSEWNKSLSYCNEGIRIDSHSSTLRFRKGLLLSYLGRFAEAEQEFRIARSITPDVASQYFSNAFINPYDMEALKNGPDPRFIFLEKANADGMKCVWTSWNDYSKVFENFVATASEKSMSRNMAFRLFSKPVMPELRLSFMKKLSDSISAQAKTLRPELYSYPKKVRQQLRIGYISADFYQHPTAILTRQLYRLHDRTKLKVYAYSLVKTTDQDIYQKEIASNCDVFHDASKMNAVEVADLIHGDEIDILVDLGQYSTLDAKLEILALKPAPIQINYLAFLGTTGAEYIDYALVDKNVVPDDLKPSWSENLIRLPHSLYMYDNQISHAHTNYKRSDFGLPDEGIVFCCFNNDYKIEPEIFSLWMDILNVVPNSVLWLLGSNEDARSNLTQYANQSGIDSSRLVFGGKISFTEHLKRYQLADIFLDTHWFNGHTTALEALWQGLPVLTYCGQVSSSRVAASFLQVLGLQELITYDADEYRKQAIHYAIHHEDRVKLRNKLASAIKTSPLFNTSYTVKHLELAYELAWSRYINGLIPADIDVPAIPQLNW